MTLFVFEHICGGALAGRDLPPALALQGGAMLQAVLDDGRAVGAEVLTTLDPRAPVRGEGAEVTPVGPRTNLAALFDRLARRADATLIIAPETDGTLEFWAQRVASLGVRSLGCDVGSIRLCGDKERLAAHLRDHGVAATLPIAGDIPGGDDFPVVVKPVDGAGCEQTFVCRSRREWRRARVAGESGVITQRCCHWPHGVSAGVCLVVTSDRIVPLICRRQRIGVRGNGPLQLVYEGGEPLTAPPLVRRAEHLARKAVKTVPGLSGVVGVDVMLGPTAAGDTVIEINPRLTLSYTAVDPRLRRRWIEASAGDPAGRAACDAAPEERGTLHSP